MKLMRSIFFNWMAGTMSPGTPNIQSVSIWVTFWQVPADIIQRMLDLIQVGFRDRDEIIGDNGNINKSWSCMAGLQQTIGK